MWALSLMLKVIRILVYWIPTDWHSMLNSVTHNGVNTLDLVISRESRPIIIWIPSVIYPCLSSNKGKTFGDHLAVKFIINMDGSDCIQRKIKYRKYGGINIKDFIEDLQSSQQMSNCSFVLKKYQVETRNFLVFPWTQIW